MTRATYAHPVALGALALLLLNDHVLKPRVPGPVTGKLSDVAGPVVLAALLGPLAARLVRRPWAEAAAWWAVAVAFAAVKVVPAVNAAAVTVLTALVGPSAIVRDASDVLGLLALPLAWRLTRSAPARPPRALRVAAAVVACGAVTATSYAPEPRVVELKTEKGAVVAVVDDNGVESSWRSTDGRTWRRGTPFNPVVGSAPPSSGPTRTCRELRCYRITATWAVEESTDGGVTWRESVPAPENTWDRPTGVAFVPSHNDVAIVAVVAVGEAGVLRRFGEGQWQPVAVGPARPGREPQESLLPLPDGPLLVALVLGALGLVLAGVVAVVVTVSRRGRSAAAAASSPRRRRS